ncbi:hypothetical protein GCM10007874_18610 [Labrys miyagiensis]|uniref:DUF1467 family protein n=1 Tax=Labrys miyagiensis TaxID=346912 RepID=A0ABQ6CGD1_9HYPH|nr:DUF1467 family protein [Labrys miyagiensis]GLS18844.1 hypothetical protein GCM10007874_18610 [Labrys miyagiensis]
MSPVLCIALFFVIWWMVLFAVLPLGVKSQFEAGDVVPGSEGAAPQKPMLLKKAGITTVIAIIVFTIVYLVVTRHLMPHQIFDLVPNLNQ